jgi:hypothetical protein
LEQTIDGLDGAIGEPSLQESYDTAPMFLGDPSTQYSDAWLQVRRACSYTALPKMPSQHNYGGKYLMADQHNSVTLFSDGEAHVRQYPRYVSDQQPTVHPAPVFHWP